MIKEMLASLKEVVLNYIKHRLFPVTIIVIIMFSVIIRRLFVLQIIEGEEHLDNFMYKAEKTLAVEAVRGNIYDRNGKLLAYNELSYSVTFSNATDMSQLTEELGMSENEIKNRSIKKVISILAENGDSISVDFPIKHMETGAYRFLVKEEQLKSFLRDVYSVMEFDDLTDDEKNSTAETVVNYLADEIFEISKDYTEEERFLILCVRYKLWMNRFQQYMPVTIAYDISEKSNAAIKEREDELIGMDISVKSLRRYNYAEYFAHIIGYVGGISSDELTAYNDELDEENKYYAGEIVGKTGIEQYCESELRGKTGHEKMYVDNLGKVIEVVESTPATAGNDIYLTLDADLQKYCYDTLEKEIASILLANIENITSVEPGENAKIPITDVYFALFDNNYLSISDMADKNATSIEKSIYQYFLGRKRNTIDEIEKILTVTHSPLYAMSEEYQDYMEYICEILSANDIYDSSLVPKDSAEFLKYTSNQISFYDYMKYVISIEAIDISYFDTESEYYDNDEIYDLICEYVINYLNQDTDFDKFIVNIMIHSSEITGYDVVNLLYEQGVLSSEGDLEYEEFRRGVYGPYDFMLRKIKNLEITPAMLALDPCSGSVVVTDVNTGNVLANVSYPSYDNNYLTNEVDAEYYSKLLNDKTSPMYSRSTQQQTAPGSTFKILSSVAGMSEGIVTHDSLTNCTGKFMIVTTDDEDDEKTDDEDEDKKEPESWMEAKCWIYPGGHGNVAIEEAIEQSCNVYFYQVGYDLAKNANGKYDDGLGITNLKKYATLFGLDELSGVEMPEVAPHVSDNDAVRSAIGQGTNLYAPIQLARYITTVANSGVCYNLTLIDKITDYEGKLIRENEASVLHKLDIDKNIWDSVHAGMRRVISNNAPKTALINSIKVNVAAKSGTAQENKERPNHATYISYAPYEKPEVSVTCVIQHGYSSGNAQELAGFIYAYMYDPDKLIGAEISGNNMISD